jgi:peptidoglycan/xylan/chitin deacetylase (PgdA/CDA1 family)
LIPLAGVFSISLDFELHWGVFDKRNRAERMPCYRQTCEIIPAMLEQFARHKVAVTWATVGSLFAENEEEWRSVWPHELPAYIHPKYSAYQYILQQGIGSTYAPAHFAPQTVQLILQYPQQELATHTFSHYYCLEQGQSVDAFKADLKVVQHLARLKTGKPVTSLVFPRNQFNKAYLEACFQMGITAIRSNPPNWFWTGIANDETSMLRKMFRTGDVFVPMGARNTYDRSRLQPVAGEPLSIPASRLLRQYDPKRPFLNKQRIQRILGEMEYAARHQQYYHLWWHPENFGYHPQECLSELHTILEYYTRLAYNYGMASETMFQTAVKHRG